MLSFLTGSTVVPSEKKLLRKYLTIPINQPERDHSGQIMIEGGLHKVNHSCAGKEVLLQTYGISAFGRRRLLSKKPEGVY